MKHSFYFITFIWLILLFYSIYYLSYFISFTLYKYILFYATCYIFGALTLLVGRQEGHPAWS